MDNGELKRVCVVNIAWGAGGDSLLDMPIEFSSEVSSSLESPSVTTARTARC